MSNELTIKMAEELSALDAALADLDFIEGSSAEAPEEVKAAVDVDTDSDVDVDLLESIEGDIAIQTMAQEGYDEVPADTAESSPKAFSEKDVQEIAEEAEKEEKRVEKEDKAEDTKPTAEDTKPTAEDIKPTGPKVSAPKARAGASLSASEALKVRLGGIEAVSATLIHSPDDAKLSSDEFDKLISSRMMLIDLAPKKVGEKLVNAYSNLASGASLSVYTELAIELLIKKGSITSQDIFEKYRARPYSEGTSRSQSGQLMKVLPLMGLAERSGSTLKLIEDSVLAQAFSDKLGIEWLSDLATA